MNRALCKSCLLLIFVPMLSAQGPTGDKPKIDTYGDQLPPGAVMRMGTIRLRHPEAAIAFSPDGKTLISAGSSGDVRFWEMATGKEIRRVQLQRTGKEDTHIRGHKLSADGKVFACWEQGDNAFAVYDTETGKQLHRFPTGSKEWGWVLLSDDGKTVASAGRHEDHETVTVQVWDVPTGKKKWERTDKGISWGLSLSPDGRRIILGRPSREQSMDVVDLDSGKELGSIKARTFHCCFSADGKLLACALLGRPGGVVFWDTQTLAEKRRLEFLSSPNLQLHSVSADGKVIACSDLEGLILRPVDNEKPCRIPFTRPSNVIFSPDGKRLAAAGSEGVRVFDVATGKPLHDLPGHQGSVSCVTVSRDDKFVASCASFSDRHVNVWDTATGNLLQSLECENRSVASCDFLADGKQLLTGGAEGTVQLWDWASKKELLRFRMDSGNGRGNQVHGHEAIRISVDSKRVMAVGVSYLLDAKANFYIWDAETGGLLEKRPFGIDIVSQPTAGGGSRSRMSFNSCFSPDGGQVTHWSKTGLQITESLSGRPLATILGNFGRPTAFSFDARLLTAGIRKEGVDPFESQIEAIGIYETITGKEVARLNTGSVHLHALSSDNLFLAVSGPEHVSFWDIGAGKEVHKLAMPKGLVPHPSWSPASALAFVPGQRRLVTGMADGTLLVWDLAQLYGEPAAEPIPNDNALRRLWDALQGDDARAAFQAQASLAAAPKRAVRFLKDRLPPAGPIDAKRVEALIADLDNEQFTVREKAASELAKMGEQIQPMLKRAKDNNPSAETTRRIRALLNAPHAPPSGEQLRTLRAIAVLERVGTAEAREVLRQLAGGDAAARETREAKEALTRSR